jgi:hypothetical protein
MKIKHNKETGSLSIHFSWREILTMVLKKKLTFDAFWLRQFSSLIFTAVVENINSKKYDDKK